MLITVGGVVAPRIRAAFESAIREYQDCVYATDFASGGKPMPHFHKCKTIFGRECVTFGLDHVG
jgi:hypothetical protein